MTELNKIPITVELVEGFSLQFINNINELKESLKSFGIELTKAMPDAFTGNSIAVRAVYSEDREHILLMFRKNDSFQFSFSTVKGDVFDSLDPYGIWKRLPRGMRISNSTGVSLKNVGMHGLKPFDIYGENIEIMAENLKLEVPNGFFQIWFPLQIDYAFIFSVPIFMERLENIKQYVSDFTKVYWEYYVQNKPKDKLKAGYEKIKREMERLFFDETILEQEIDDFISENPLILDVCLGLETPLRQVTLENIHGLNPKDYRPDLIAYDKNNKIWKIVDYKRAKRNMIRNVGKARAHFKAEITELKAQLNDYREYFYDKAQREHFYEKTGYFIEYPETIGIIGNLAPEEIREFNRLKSTEQRWLEIIPYNYLYERYCRFLSTMQKVMNS